MLLCIFPCLSVPSHASPNHWIFRFFRCTNLQGALTVFPNWNWPVPPGQIKMSHQQNFCQKKSNRMKEDQNERGYKRRGSNKIPVTGKLQQNSNRSSTNREMPLEKSLGQLKSDFGNSNGFLHTFWLVSNRSISFAPCLSPYNWIRTSNDWSLPSVLLPALLPVGYWTSTGICKSQYTLFNSNASWLSRLLDF